MFKIITKNWMYELPHELPKNVGLTVLKNEELSRLLTWLFVDLMIRRSELVTRGFKLVSPRFYHIICQPYHWLLTKKKKETERKRIQSILQAVTWNFNWISFSCIICRTSALKFEINYLSDKISFQSTKQKKSHKKGTLCFSFGIFLYSLVCCIEKC